MWMCSLFPPTIWGSNGWMVRRLREESLSTDVFGRILWSCPGSGCERERERESSESSETHPGSLLDPLDT